MMHNYTLIDALGTIGAASIFPIVFISPGFVLGWISNVLGFRQRSPAERLLQSVALSLATAPIVMVLVSRVAGFTACIAMFCVLSVAAASLAWRCFSRDGSSFQYIPRSTWLGFGLMALWATIATATVVDLQFGDRLYPTAAIYDYSLRVPLVESVARSGVPPVNPFFDTGKVPKLRYFYYWYVICALPERLARLPGRACFNASVIWSGFALAAIIPLFLKHFFREHDALRRKSLIGISLLIVTGLDLIPYSIMLLRLHIAFPDLEWWDRNQVTSWLDSLIWVPHHVAALTACMAGLLVLSSLDENAGLKECVWAVVISGFAFASTAGLSAFVAFTFAIFLILWMIIQIVQRRVRDSLTYATAGLLALILSLPYLADLHSPSRIGQRFAVLAIPALSVAIRRLPRSVLIYILEFGFFLWVGLLRLKTELFNKERLTQPQQAAWLLLATSLLTVLTLQSDPKLTGTNDLGFRAMLLGQFVLLLWATPLIHDLSAPRALSPIGRVWKALLVSCLVLGAFGTVSQLVMLRCYVLLADSGWIRRGETYFGPSPEIGKRIYALREGLEAINRDTNKESVLQHNPVSGNVTLIHLYSSRQTAAGFSDCGSTFGGDPELCQAIMPSLKGLFNSPEEARSADLDRLCDSLSINMLVATAADPVWRDTGSWVWSKQALVSNPSVRGIVCGGASAMPATRR